MRCLILTWTPERAVTGYVFERKNFHTPPLPVDSFAAEPAQSFSQQLYQVRRNWSRLKFDAIVLGGDLPGLCLCELVMPAAPMGELNQALEFELARQFPGSAETLYSSWRLIGDGRDGSRIRLLVCRREAMDDLFTDCLAAGLQFDAFCHPFMAADEARDSEDIAVPECSPGLVWKRAEGTPKPLRSLQLGASVEGAAEPGALMAEYALSEKFQRDAAFLSPRPPALRPQRLKLLKFAAAVAAVTALALAGLLWYRTWDDRKARLNAIAQEIADIEYLQDSQMQGMEELRALGETAGKLMEAVDTIAPGPALRQLEAVLPDNTWISAFRCTGGNMTLTLSVTGSTDLVVDALNRKLTGLAVESLRQELNKYGSSTVTVTLASVAIGAEP